jgi:hypothetical protein
MASLTWPSSTCSFPSRSASVRLTAAKPKDRSYPTSLKTLSDHLRGRLDLGLRQKECRRSGYMHGRHNHQLELNRAEPNLQLIPRIIFDGLFQLAGIAWHKIDLNRE